VAGPMLFRGQAALWVRLRLSYTSFAYDNLKITPLEAKPGDPVAVEGDVKNTGATAEMKSLNSTSRSLSL